MSWLKENMAVAIRSWLRSGGKPKARTLRPHRWKRHIFQPRECAGTPQNNKFVAFERLRPRDAAGVARDQAFIAPQTGRGILSTKASAIPSSNRPPALRLARSVPRSAYRIGRADVNDRLDNLRI